ncbi:MAG: redoxin domain-containing protein [Gammaproteobacteria bacterium]|jgi:peroxiredoxin Q/BCP|nr:redoxin domain-containing protein [Gammaproteobacteria bacterium]
MSKPKVGNKAPDFTLPATGDQKIKLSALRGRPVVLYFYPKDSTPGCTQEGQDFRDRHADFAKHDSVILGVSRDSLRSHENFKAKQAFPFELLADTEETVCQRYDVIKEKNMYGRKVLGVERSTFLIDAEGKLVREWRKVKVKGHVDEVLAAVAAL